MTWIKDVDLNIVLFLFIIGCNLLTLFRIRFVLVSAGLYKVLSKHVFGVIRTPNSFVFLLIFSILSVLLCLFAPVVYYQLHELTMTFPHNLITNKEAYEYVLLGGGLISLVNYIAVEVVGVILYCKIISLQYKYQRKVLESCS